MKIALVFDGLQIGGVERVGSDYAKLLLDLGHNVTIVNLNPHLLEMEKEFPSECEIMHIVYPRKLAAEQYAQLVKRGRWGAFVYPIAILIFETISEVYKNLIRIKTGKKFDLTIAFSGHFNDLTFVSKRFLKSKNVMCWLHGALYSYMLISDGFFNLYKRIKNLVVLVDDAQEEVFYANHDLELKITKLYNPTCITKKVINQNNVKHLKEKYGNFVLMVSRFEYPHKDQYTVVRAIDIVRKQYGDEINMVFVGSGPEEENVKTLVASLGADTNQHIFFEGNRFNVQDYYSAAKMLVHASVAGEGLPTVMIEALAYKLPMVVTDSKTGPREILGNSDYGLLCKVKDSEDMAANIHKLLVDEVLYNKFKEKSSERLKNFEPDEIKRQLSDLLYSFQDEESRDGKC